jgi:hypothetical protein
MVDNPTCIVIEAGLEKPLSDSKQQNGRRYNYLEAAGPTGSDDPRKMAQG